MYLPFLLTALILFGLDFLYLNYLKEYLFSQVKSVQGSSISVRYESAIACYILLILGLYYFIIRPKRSIVDAFLLGIVIYGVYETTTYASFKSWKLDTVIMDTFWGGILFSLTTFLVSFIMSVI